jgi:hypothetical protein
MKLIATWAVLLPSVFGSSCYFSDGTEDTSAQVAPCPSLYNTKMCCWLNNLAYPDACTTQGLCLSNSSTVPFWVDACTDINWGDGCSPLGKICGSLPHSPKDDLKLTFSAVANSNESIYHPLTQCSDGSFCCGNENTTCCLASQGYYLDQSGSILAAPSASSIKISATITTYVTATATSAVSTTNTSNKGAVIGLASALGVVSLVGLTALLFAVWRFRRSKSNSHKNGDGIYQPHFDAKNPRAELQNTGLDPHQNISEINGESHITELPGETTSSKDPTLL